MQRFTVDRPEINSSEAHRARLAQQGLEYGAVEVYLDKTGTYWATGDYKHCGKAIDHNIARIVEIMKAEKLTYMGKAYDSDLYKSKSRGDANSIINSKSGLVAVNPQLPISSL